MGTVPSPDIVGAVDAGQNIFANRLAEYQRMAQLQQQMGIEKQQAEQQAEAFPVQQQQRQATLQQTQIENAAKQQQADQQKQAATLQPKFVTRDENGKVTGFDNEGYENALTEAGLGQLAIAHQTQRADAVSKLAAADKTTRDKIKDIHQGMYERLEGIKGITNPAERQQHYLSSLRWAQQNGVDVGQWPTQAPSNDQLTHFEGDLGMSGQLLADADKKAETDKKNADAARVGHVPGVDVPFSPAVQQQKVAIASAEAKAKAQAQVALGGGMDQAAVDQAAEMYHLTGKLPPGGRGVAGLAQNRKIMNRAAELYPGSLTTDSAEYAANKKSLEGLQKQFDQVTAFENTAGKNLDTFLNQAKKVVDVGSPLVNMPLRKAASMAGSADQAAFNAARTTALTEIAKVLNSSNASGVLSDTARKEVEELIGPNASLSQIYQAAGILKQDMENRRVSYQDQIKDIKGRLGGKKSEGNSPQSEGTFSVKAPNGKTYRFKDQKSLDAFKQAANIP